MDNISRQFIITLLRLDLMDSTLGWSLWMRLSRDKGKKNKDE